MTKKILFTSLKGGVGVTTVCAKVGLALAEKGLRTLLVDGETAYSAAAMSLGLASLQVYTLADYANGACRAKQTLIAHPKATNFLIMPAAGLSDRSAFSRAVSDIDGLFDFILLDKVHGAGESEAIIVTEPYAPSIKAADVCRARLQDKDCTEISLIVNKFSAAQFAAGEIASAKQIAYAVNLPLSGVICEDLTLSAGRCKASTRKYFAATAEMLSGGREDLPNLSAAFSGLNGFIKRKMRERI